MLPLSLADPWDAPPLPLDLDLVQTSQRLMEISDLSQSDPETADPVATVTRAHQQELQQLRQQFAQEKHHLLQRNIQLRAELVQLQSTHQQLLRQLATQQQPEPGWLARLWQQLGLG